MGPEWGFPNGSVVKNPPAMQEMQEMPVQLGRSSEKGNGNPLQYSFWENPMDRGAWQATVHGVTKNQMWLSMKHNTMMEPE